MERIDVVLPWVNGNDPTWVEKKKAYSNINSDSTDSVTANQNASDNRYFDYGTLKYALRSIEKNMPWVGKIFLLTDNQIPDWLNTESLEIVDHTEFISGTLPTFNSNVILTNLHRIPNLAEHFVLMNDDLIVWRMTKPTDFFKSDLPVDALIETGTVPFTDGFFHISQNGVALANELFDKRKIMKEKPGIFFNIHYGISQLRTILSLPYKGFLGFMNPHLAMPYRKSDFLEFEKEFSDVLLNTGEHRFRDFSDVNEWAIRYVRNLKGNFAPGKIKGEFLTLRDFEKEIRLPSKTSIIAINDDNYRSEQSMHNMDEFLNSRFSEKSRYEL